ncbi:hypothetical protein PZA11_004857 [Diplocarpon coronariae]
MLDESSTREHKQKRSGRIRYREKSSMRNPLPVTTQPSLSPDPDSSDRRLTHIPWSIVVLSRS